MTIICTLGIHQWAPWKDKREGRYIIQSRLAGILWDERYDGSWVEQSRHCDRCGRLELRTVDAQ